MQHTAVLFPKIERWLWSKRPISSDAVLRFDSGLLPIGIFPAVTKLSMTQKGLVPHFAQLVWFAITSERVEMSSRQLPWSSAPSVTRRRCGGEQRLMSICFFNADSVELFTANFCGTLLHDCTKLGQVQGCFIHVDDQFFREVVSLSQCPNSFY